MKLSPELKKFTNALRGRPKVLPVVAEFRTRLEAAEIDTAVDILLSNPKWRLEFSSAFPRAVSDVKASPPLSLAPLRRELQWARAWLRRYSTELAEYVSMRKTYHHALLRGRYSEASRALATIESALGESLWLQKARILIAQLTGGLEAQKALTEKLKAESPVNQVVAYIAHFTSVRTEPSMRAATYLRRITEELGGGGLNWSFAAYLRYHLAPVIPLTLEEANCVLAYEATSPAIDYFTSVVDAVCAIVRSGGPERGVAIRLADSLGRETGDRRLRFISSLFGSSTAAPEISDDAVNASNDLLCGRMSDALRISRGRLETYPEDCDAQQVLAHALAETDDGSILRRDDLPTDIITRASAAALRRGDDLADGLDTLTRWANQLTGSELQRHLARSVAQSGHGLDPAYDMLDWQDWALTIPGLFSDRLLELSDEDDIGVYARKLQNGLPDGLAKKMAWSIERGEIDRDLLRSLTEERKLLTQAAIAEQRGQHGAAVRAARQLQEMGTRPLRNLATQLLGQALLAQRDFSALVTLIPRTILRDPSSLQLLPLRETVDALDRNTRRGLAAAIELPVLYELYSRHVGTDFDDIRGAVCWAFCRAAGVERPSQLKDVQERYGKEELIYFWRSVCTEDVMATSQIFASTRAVSEERLLLCRLLASADPDQAQAYETETGDILRRISLNRRMQVIEQSKVYVDALRIRKHLPDRAREAWARYHALLLAGESVTAMLRVEQIVEEVRTGQGQAILLVPPNEMRQALAVGVTAIRDEYVSSTEYGLDGYLSVNIRHGTLVGQLRSPLEASHLITRRVANSPEYRDNEHWMAQLTSKTGWKDERVRKAFQRVSREFDALVDEVNLRWLRIQKEENGDGMLRFGLGAADYVAVAERVNMTSTFEDFVGAVFDILNRKLEASLANVRARVKGDLEERCLGLLDRLQSEVETVYGDQNSRALAAAVGAARTGLQTVVNRITNWFRVAKGVVFDPFAIEDAINLCVETIKRYEPTLVVRVNVCEAPPEVLKGHLLPSMYYVFSNALDNVVKHSMTEPPEATIDVSVDNGGSVVVIRNRVSEEVALRLGRELPTRRQELRQASGGSLVSREGGTGLYKMKAILERECSAGNTLDIEVTNNEFVVRFRLPEAVYERVAA
jgi:hypothetical protein